MKKIKNIISKSIYFVSDNKPFVYLLLAIVLISGNIIINYSNSQTYEITVKPIKEVGNLNLEA